MSAAMAFMIQAERARKTNSPFSTHYSAEAQAAYPSTPSSKRPSQSHGRPSYSSSERTLSSDSSAYGTFQAPKESEKKSKGLKKKVKGIFH